MTRGLLPNRRPDEAVTFTHEGDQALKPAAKKTPAALPTEGDAAPPPDARTRARAEQARTRTKGRLSRFSVAFKATPTGLAVTAEHNDLQAHSDIARDAFGSTSDDFLTAEILRIMDALKPRDKASPDRGEVNAALAVIDGSRPDDELSAMLASQAAATHALAMHFIGRTRRAETLDALNAYGTMATRFQRTFVAQIEALTKLKRGGAQTMEIRHVHVTGNAIIGNVGTGAGGGVAGEFSPQPHGSPELRTLAAPACAALPGEDAKRETVSAPRRDRPKKMQASRRR